MNNGIHVRENKTVLCLSALLVLIVAAAIGQSGWTDGLGVLLYAGLGSVVVGVLISRSLLPGLIAHLLSTLVGVAWSFWVSAQLLPANFSFYMSWLTMRNNLINWITLALNGEIIRDNSMFVLQMALIIWGLGYVTIWFLFRSGKIWGAIVPGAVVLLINLYYAPNDLTNWFISYLLLSLLLLVQFNLYEYEQRWRQEQMHYRSDISFDFLRNGLVFSIAVISLAWFTPAVTDQNATTFFNQFDRQWRGVQTEWNRLFAGLNYKPQANGNPNAYAQTHALGGSRELTSQPVMYVQAPGGRYWRAAAYDDYDGQTWDSNDDQQVRFSGTTMDISLPQYAAREPFTQTYTTLQEGLFILYAMANPTAINIPTMAKANLLSAEHVENLPQWADTASPWGEEITYIESDARLKVGDTYQAISQRSVASKEQLRSDHVDYPQWVHERYLSIPETTTQRVLDLAISLTENSETVYDKVEIIERYMRNQIAYNEKLSAPPPNRDKVDYILFDVKEAYCDYYATSMIVMLRALGIPARFSVGYAQGLTESLKGDQFQEEVYLVRNLDAHSWVEVYFPTYGWVEFEPTAAQPVVVRRTETNVPIVNPGVPDDLFEDDPFNQLDDIIDDNIPQLDNIPGNLADNYNISLPFFGSIQAPRASVNWGAGILLVLTIGFASYSAINAFSVGRNNESITHDVYLTLLKIARWMGLAKHPSQTPHEHATILADHLPPIKDDIDLITDEFVQQAFSNRSYPEANKSRVLQAWDRMRPKLYRAVFERGLAKLKLPFKW